MANPVSFRLSEDSMTVIQAHAANLSALYHRTVDRTEALEHILEVFDHKYEKGIGAKIKKALSMPDSKSLADYFQAPAQVSQEIVNDQLQEALH